MTAGSLEPAVYFSGIMTRAGILDRLAETK